LLIGSLLLSDAALAQQGSLQQPAPSSARAARKDTSLKIQELFEQAHQALRTNRRGDAVAPMQQAIALAERFPPGDQKRIEALSQAGTLLWSVNRKELAEASLLAAVKQMEFSPKAASPETSRATFHMLGVIYRDERRHVDAIPWFQRAVDVSATLPDAHPEETEAKFFALASELRALAWAQCRADDPQAADATDQRRIEACTRLRRPGSVNECRDGKRTCVGRWMSQSH
jgi:tetratricopeptide (TPR) repeat protein